MIRFNYQGKDFKFEEHDGGNPIRRLRSGRFYEKTMLDFIQGLEPKYTIIDVGANIGNHSVYFGALTNCKRVISIEPQPTAFKKLSKNIENNKLEDKVLPMNIAAGEKKGTCSLYWKAEDKLGGTQTVDGDDTEMNALDNIIGNKKVSIIKMDIEGYEPSALIGAKRILEKQDPYLFIEIWSKAEKKKIDNILKPMGYLPVRAFNSSATYFYKKNYTYGKGLTWLWRFSKYKLSTFRIFRQTS